ncbi:MAG: putative dsRNA-binding protein, partial [Atopostipes sp.]|nr:putative dsRNA-binding protein [Atopostipes sp.]
SSIKIVKDFLRKSLFQKITVGDSSHGMDYKTNLQEYLQKNGVIQIEYQVIDSFGPDHARVFKVAVLIEGEKMGIGEGSSKKRAQQAAAKEAFKNIRQCVKE